MVKGLIRVNARNPTEAYVTPLYDNTILESNNNIPKLDKDIYLDGLICRNRAMEGDTVIVELYPQNKWKVMKNIQEEKVIALDIFLVLSPSYKT